jgi:hypothetical protein
VSRPGRALAPGKGPPVSTVQEAGWAPEPVWTQRIEEKSFAPAGDRTPIARSSIYYFTYIQFSGAEVAQSAQCLTTDWTTGVRSPAEAKDVSSSLCVQTCPASYLMGTMGHFPGSKAWPGSEADHSPSSSAEIENEQELYFLSPFVPAWRSGVAFLFFFTYTYNLVETAVHIYH